MNDDKNYFLCFLSWHGLIIIINYGMNRNLYKSLIRGYCLMRSSIIYGLIGIVFIGFFGNIYAQTTGPIDMRKNSSGSSVFQANKPQGLNLRSFSLLDPDRFTMRQQSVVSYSSSGSYGSNLIGMYINTMEYRFNMPLTMRLKVAYRNNMGNLLGSNASFGGRTNTQNGNLFIPSFDMVYKPWKNTTISFHYRDYSGMSSNGMYGNRSNRLYSPYMRY